MRSIIKDWLGGSNKLERFWLLAKIEFKLRYYENFLGLIWALIKPISDILIYYIAFEVIMKSGVDQYISFLFIGLISWVFFTETTVGTTQILATKKYLYEYTNMNKMEIYLSTIGSNAIGFFFNFIMFVAYYLLFEKGDTRITWHWLFFIPIFFNLIILSLAFSLILSNLYIIAKDISQIWNIVSSVGFWLSPILFNPVVFSQRLGFAKYINPISSIVINARYVIMDHRLPEWKLFLWGYLYAIFFLLIGIYLLNKLGAKAAEKL